MLSTIEIEVCWLQPFNICMSVPAAVRYETVHRIIEQFGLQGTFQGHLVQPPCNKQGHLLLDQAAQSPIQPNLECFQGWGIHHLSGQPVPVFHYPHCKKPLAYIQAKSTLF